MRDPDRIPLFLQALEKLWLANPDQRFGQLVMNLSRTSLGFPDTWDWEEDKWLERINKYDSK